LHTAKIPAKNILLQNPHFTQTRLTPTPIKNGRCRTESLPATQKHKRATICLLCEGVHPLFSLTIIELGSLE
jgi:hypothetical protein